jgi:hypothetical protein
MKTYKRLGANLLRRQRSDMFRLLKQRSQPWKSISTNRSRRVMPARGAYGGTRLLANQLTKGFALDIPAGLGVRSQESRKSEWRRCTPQAGG